jgi:hypothetical protein
VLERRGGLEGIRKSEGRVDSGLEGSTRAAATAKRRVGDAMSMTTLKNRELLGLSNTRVSERFGRGGGTKVYGRSGSSRFRALLTNGRNFTYKRRP